MIQQSMEKIGQVETRSNPFPGLRPFELHESYLFFGRDGQSEQVISKLARNRFLAVIGTSGSGKSSLVRAGLLPSLLTGFMNSAGSNWRMAIMRPGNDPNGNLARALNDPEVFGSEHDKNRAIQISITEAALRRGSLGLVDVVTQNGMASTENLLVLADQFEEIFRYGRITKDQRYENDAKAFVKLLLEASQQRGANVFVVLTMRSDYLGDCSQFQDLPEAINDGQYLIPRLTRDQRREAIEGPIAVAGGKITSRLVNRLLNDVGDSPDQLPILQHALMRAWDACANRKDDHKSSHQGEALDLCCYEAIGRMSEALSLHADEAYSELPDGPSTWIAEKLFKYLTEKGTDNREIRRPVNLRDACAAVDASEKEVIEVIGVFRKSGRSFLMPPAEAKLDGESLIDISHESLIRNWKRLRDWVDDEARSARIYRRLAETAELHRKGEAGLWGDPDLQLALDWQEENSPNQYWASRYHPGFETAMAFLRTSEQKRADELAETERRHAEEAERAKRELEQAQALADAERQKAKEQQRRLEEQKRATAKLRRLLSALFVVAFFALCTAGVASYAYRKANRASIAAEQQKQMADGTAYFANMNLARSAFERGNHELGYQLLATYMPVDSVVQNQNDLSYLRSFYWYYLWRQNNKESDLEGHKSSVLSVAFSPDARMLASGSDDNTVKLWDVQTRKEITTLQGHKRYVTSVAFSPDGRTLASASDDNSVKLWDVGSRKEIKSLEGHLDGVHSVAFSRDGRTLASGSDDNTVKLWDVRTQKEIATLKGHKQYVSSVAFSPDGRMLASASGDNTVKLWDVQSQQEIKTLTGHKGAANSGPIPPSVRSVAFSPDGRILASAGADNTVKLWDVQSRTEIKTLEGHKDSVASVAFSPDGRTLASGSDDRAVKLWDVQSQKEIKTLVGHDSAVWSVAFSPDGSALASASHDNTVKLWDVSSQKETRTLEGHQYSVNSVAFSPDGRTLASAGNDNTVKLWDVQSQTEIKTLQGHRMSINSVAFSPDGRMLASASADNTVKLWDLQSGTVIKTLEGHNAAVWSVAFSPDGQTLASASADKTVKLWDVQSWTEIRTLEGHADPLRSVAFSPDGLTLASGSDDKTVKLWDVRSLKEIKTLEGHKDGVNSVAFSPDGRTLASSCDDNTIKLWDVESGKEIKTLERHKAEVWSVAFSPDGKSFASASRDKTVRVWNMQTLKEIAMFDAHKYSVRSVAFSPDGRTLASASDDKTVKLWFGATDEEIAWQTNKP